MRFTDQSMLNARKTRRIMKWKLAEQNERAGSPEETEQAVASLFSLYQKNVDAHDPNHALSSKNTRKKWRLGQNAASIAGHLRKTPTKRTVKVHPSPFMISPVAEDANA